jgi:hypothetical protein
VEFDILHSESLDTAQEATATVRCRQQCYAHYSTPKTLLERVVFVPSPTERATRDVSPEASCASNVKPLVVALKRALQNIIDDNGVQTMKTKIVKEIDLRFGDVIKEPLNALAKLVDPRYRGKLFAPSEIADAMKWLTELTEKTALPSVTPLLPSLATTTSPVIESAAKRSKLNWMTAHRSTCWTTTYRLEQWFASSAVLLIRSLITYVSQILNASCVPWNGENFQKDYPRVAAVAMQYL